MPSPTAGRGNSIVCHSEEAGVLPGRRENPINFIPLQPRDGAFLWEHGDAPKPGWVPLNRSPFTIHNSRYFQDRWSCRVAAPGEDGNP